MSKRDSEPQFDFGLQTHNTKVERFITSASVVPFIDAMTLQVRRDAIRRVAANGIFAPHSERKKG